MRRRVLLAAGVMVVALLLAAVIASAPFSAAISGMPADIPAKGDTWKYNVIFYYHGGITAIGTLTVNVTGTVDVKAGVNETEQYHCYNYTAIQEVEVIGSSINETTIKHDYYSDGTVIASHYYVKVHSSWVDWEEEGQLMRNYSCYYNDTIRVFDFPLEEGKTWSKNVSVYFIGWWLTSDTTGTWENITINWTNVTPINITVTGEVINVTEVETGAGTFECWLVNLTNAELFYNATTGDISTAYSLVWYSPEVKNYVYREDYLDGELIATWNLTSYSVSYPIHEMVQTLTLFTLWNMQQQQQQTNMMIMAGGGAATATATTGVAVYYLRRR